MMPSKSKAQHNFMAAVAHNPAFAKKAGVPQSVGKEFNQADKGRKFSKGGDMKKMNMGGYADGGMPMKDGKPAFVGDGKGKMAKGGIATSLKAHAAAPASKAHGMKKGGMAASKMGSVKTSASRDGIATKGKTKGTMIKMNKGGYAC
jgi:hypothetical protein